MNEEELEKLIQYCEYTKYNVNRAVLNSLINEGNAYTYRTVLYTDGTLIINERSTDINANVAEHGEATNVYDAMDEDHPYIFSEDEELPWFSELQNILTAEVGSAIQPTSTAYWFASCSNCTDIDVNLLDTSNVTDMTSMFNACAALTTLDLSNFDTSKTTNMNAMFGGCTALTTLDLSNFDTSKTTNMRSMISACRALTSLNITSFDTSNVTNMNGMFAGTNVLTTFDLSSFDTRNVLDMGTMLAGVGATTIYASDAFVVSQVTSSNYMFIQCNNLVGGNGTVYNPTKTDKTYARIDVAGTPGYFTTVS